MPVIGCEDLDKACHMTHYNLREGQCCKMTLAAVYVTTFELKYCHTPGSGDPSASHDVQSGSMG